MCLGQLWVSKNIVIPIEGIKLPENCNPLDLYLCTWENFALPYPSLDLAHNVLSDWLLVPPL